MSQWECEGCGMKYRDEYGLHRHYKTCRNTEQRQTFHCEMCMKVFKTKANLRKHQSRNTPGVDVIICEKCGERCYGGRGLGEHMRVHECTCQRCGEDHQLLDRRTITPLTYVFAGEVPSNFCVGCFYDIREKFMILMMCARCKGVSLPPDVRNLLLMWMAVNEITPDLDLYSE